MSRVAMSLAMLRALASGCRSRAARFVRDHCSVCLVLAAAIGLCAVGSPVGRPYREVVALGVPGVPVVLVADVAVAVAVPVVLAVRFGLCRVPNRAESLKAKSSSRPISLP